MLQHKEKLIIFSLRPDSTEESKLEYLGNIHRYQSVHFLCKTSTDLSPPLFFIDSTQCQSILDGKL